MKEKALPDRRIQRTRQLLLSSLLELILEKGYETITVQDIIDRANVGRSTFYSHFQDKEHLLLSGSERLGDLLEEFRARSGAGESSWDLSLAIFKHAEQQRPAFKALLGKQVGRQVLDRIEEALDLCLNEHFRKMIPSGKRPLPLEVFERFLVSSFTGLLTWWLDGDLPYPAERMNEYYRELTEPAVRMMLGSS
jgi:AcrR family transcriptional regulator